MSRNVPDRLERLLEGDIREKLPEYDDAVSRDYATQSRDGTLRTSVIREAHNELDEVPDQVTQWFDPGQNVIVVLFPDDEEKEGETPEDAAGEPGNGANVPEQEPNEEFLNAIRGENKEPLAEAVANQFNEVGQLEQAVAELRGPQQHEPIASKQLE